MDGLKRTFQIPLVRFTVHIVLMVGLFLNIYNIYSWYKVNSGLSAESKAYSDLVQLNSESKNQQGYYNTDIYQEKYAKESGFKNKDEDVIDTSLVETNDSKAPNYVPQQSIPQLSNAEKWLLCFFGGNSNVVSDSNSANQLTPDCKNT
jgi:hypothetical protein